MTSNHASKRAARENAARTGRSYTAARRTGNTIKSGILLPFATSTDGHPVTLDLDDHVGLLITGRAGTGKTVAARTIAYQALMHDVDVAVVDVAMGGRNYEMLRAFTSGYATTLDEAHDVFDDAYIRARDNATLMDRHYVSRLDDIPTKHRPRKLIVIIEDVATVATVAALPPTQSNTLSEQHVTMRDNYRSLSNIIREKRGCGVSFVLITQQNHQVNNLIPGGINLVDRLMLGPINTLDRSVLLSHTGSAPTIEQPIRGRGLWESLHSEQPSIVDITYLSPEQCVANLAQHYYTATRLVPIYTEHGCDLRYTETSGERTHEATIHDDDVVARAHAETLAPGELHRLTKSPLPVPIDPVTLDLNAAQGLDDGPDGYNVDHTAVRVASQLVGAAGFTLDAAAQPVGVWLRNGEYVSVNENHEHTLDSMLDCVASDREASTWRYYALTAKDARLLGDDPDQIAGQITDDDLGFIACAPRASDLPCTVALRRDTDTWLVSGCGGFATRTELIPVPECDEGGTVDLLRGAPYIVSLGRLPIPGQDVTVGRSVQVQGLNRQWWKVVARDSRYIVVRRGKMYGVIDLSWNTTYNGVTPGAAISSLDTLGGSWGDLDDPGTILDALRTGQAQLSRRRIVAVDGLVVRK